MGLLMRNGVAYAGSNSIELTQAEYNALVSAGTVQPDTFYCIVDADNVLPASDVEYSSGVSVADKLDSLSASVNTVNSYTASYTHASITQGNIYAYSVGKIYMVTGYMRANAQIATNTVIGSVTGVTLAKEIFASSIGENGTGLRLMNYSDGRFRIERAMPANEWFSYTLIGFLA